MTSLTALIAASALAVPACAADLARGEELVQSRCFLCHGAAGESSSPVFPRLAAQNAGYVARQLADYKSGRRKSGTMQPMVEDLGAADFAALGAYFASRPALSHPPEEPALVEAGRALYERGRADSGLPACADCHGPSAHGTEQLPRLAGQHAQYIENQLRQFDKRERTNDNAVMHEIAAKLGATERRVLAAYLAGLR